MRHKGRLMRMKTVGFVYFFNNGSEKCMYFVCPSLTKTRESNVRQRGSASIFFVKILDQLRNVASVKTGNESVFNLSVNYAYMFFSVYSADEKERKNSN